MKPTTDTIHIVMATDENYTPHCGVTIASVLHNNKNADIHFHILGLEISEDSRNKLKEIIESNNKKLSFYDFDPDVVGNMPNLSKKTHITPASYIRLFLTQFLPSDIEKVLYLDCDLIVRHSIKELWQTDIKDVALAAVEDLLNSTNEAFISYDYERYRHFNAGVLLINLKYWRKNRLFEKFTDYINKNYDKIILHDQDVLNGVLFDKKMLLPHTWNMLSAYFKKNIFSLSPATYEDYGEDPKIVHYTTSLKPWNTIRYRPFYDEYFNYREKTPWKPDKQFYKTRRKGEKLEHVLGKLFGIDKILYERKMKKAAAKAIKQKDDATR